MLFALCDLTTRIEIVHLDAALSWIRYFADSVEYVFLSAKDERLSTKASQHVELVLNFLKRNPCATRSDIVRKCFQGHLSKVEIDACLDHLLGMSPPKIKVQVMARSDGLAACGLLDPHSFVFVNAGAESNELHAASASISKWSSTPGRSPL